MRALLALMFVTLAVAGCVEDEPAPEPEPQVPDAGLMLPAPGNVTHDALVALGIDIDAAALVAELRQYATDFPQRKGNHADHVAAREWMVAEFEAMGYDVFRQKFTNGIDQENICAIHWGAFPERWVIVGGHYDMTDTPGVVPVVDQGISSGIYDDGSGTMMTIELARAYAGLPLDHTIAFCAFDGEERGLQGSGALAEILTEGPIQVGNETLDVSIMGMLDLDMIGLNWPGVDAPILFDDNSQELQNFTRYYTAHLGLPANMIEFHGIEAGRSDYAHYFALGVPTGFMISDFEQWQLPGDAPATGPDGSQYPFWHRADNWETMVLMAGSEQDVIDGFQMGVNIAAGVLYFLAADADNVVTGVEK